ncbi:MAG: hypothetical protein OXE99_12670, partial [Cellvibrionales bacterium]|nr:hypothetical protein [Cellvibrionales bacterium]
MIKRFIQFASLILFSLSVANVLGDFRYTLSVDNAEYTNGDWVIFKLTLINDTDEVIRPSAIVTEFLSLEGAGFDGVSRAIFTDLSVVAKQESGKKQRLTNLGTFNPSADLTITDAVLTEHVVFEYHIKAKMNASFRQSKAVHATVDDQETNSLTITPGDVVVSATKSASVHQYTPGQSIVFTIKLENTGKYTAYYANLSDAFSEILAKDIHGNAVQAIASLGHIKATKNSNASSVGDYSQTDNRFSASHIIIAPSGWVQYEISATLATTIVSPVINSAEVTLYGEEKVSNSIQIPSEPDQVALDYQVKPSKHYKPSENITYSITASNTGSGYAVGYQVTHLLLPLSINLANTGESSLYDHRDVSGNPFSEWTVKVVSVGNHSLSQLGQGSQHANVNLSDRVTIGPGENIVYQVTAKAKAVAISAIETEVTLTQQSTGKTYSKSLSLPALDLTNNIDLVKKPKGDKYFPNQWVTYFITATNNSTSQFADNFTIKDQINSCQKVNLSDGSDGPPFIAWKLSVSDVQGEGTNPGLFDYGVEKTGDISITADLAAKGKVVYQLDAKVNPLAIGVILDDQDCPDDNVKEEGGGLATPDGRVEILKLVDKQQFVPGSDLTYTITIKNSGQGPLTNLKVVDKITSIQATGSAGTKAAFTGWKVSKKAVDSAGKPSTFSNPDVDGTVRNNEDIDTHVNIFPGDTITYTVVATTQNDLVSRVTNSVKAGDDATSETGSDPLPYILSVRKLVDKSEYSEPDTLIRYRITVSSDPMGGFAKNIPVDDDIQNVMAELLHPAGKKVAVFDSFAITTSSKGKNADPGLNEDYQSRGLHAKASIPAGGSVTYNILAKIPRRTQDYVVWGDFHNAVSVTTRDSVLHSGATTHWKLPDLHVRKTVNKPIYHPNEQVTFIITLTNTGQGYVNSASVKDSISGLKLFKAWRITTKTSGVGTRVVDLLKDNADIDTAVDIAPGGRIDIVIEGTVVDDIHDLYKVTNTVFVHDYQTDRDFESSADIEKDTTKISFSVTKDSDTIFFTPGQVFTYAVEVRNDMEEDVDHLYFYDDMSHIEGELANSKDGTATNISGNPFVRWRYKINDTDWKPWTEEDIYVPDFEMKSHQSAKMIIEAEVKDNVVSNKIRNTAYITRYKKESGETIKVGTAVYEALRIGSGGQVRKSFAPTYYKPGDEITYTIEASSQVGYFNDVAIKDAISNIEVLTLDGSMKQVFNHQWSVDVDKLDNHNGGTTDGSKDGTVADNQDLNVTIDVGAGDKVTYSIRGKVRDDAVGNVNNDGQISRPFPNHVTYNKTVEQDNYVAGENLTYTIRITNTGKVHLNNMVVRDLLTDIMTTDTDGKPIKAFTAWTIKANLAEIHDNPQTGAKPSYKELYNPGKFDNNRDLDIAANIPIGGEINWVIIATVNPDAAGDITNTGLMGTNTTSVTSHPAVTTYGVTKTVTQVYDKDKNPIDTTHYSPGGYVEYTVRIDWLSGSNAKDMPVVDRLSEATTNWFDGSNGKAFERWEITAKTDDKGVTDAGVYANNTDINTLIDLGVEGFVEYTITAKIMDEAVGEISNRVSVGRHSIVSDRLSMAEPDLKLTKQAFTGSGKSEPKSRYKPLDTFTYVMTLSNEGLGTIYSKKVKDIISAIETDIAETSVTAGTNPKGNPFVSWSVSENHIVGRVTNVGKFTPGANKDINTSIDIAPGDLITFTVEATIAENVLGNITNTMTSGKIDASQTLTPELSDFSLEKNILSVDGEPYQLGETYYKPGDSVVYQVTFINKSGVWLNNYVLNDWVSNVQAPLGDGTTGCAFSSWKTVAVSENAEGYRGDTYVPDVPDNSDINLELDVAPFDRVIVTITAQIKLNAMGEIDGNGASIGSLIEKTDPLKPAPSRVDRGKSTTFSSTGDTNFYENNGQLSFAMEVVNSGEGFAQGVTIKDLLSQAKSDDGQLSFSNFTVTMDDSQASHSSIFGDYQGNKDLDAVANIAPGEKYIFKVTTQVTPTVTGTIDNMLSVSGSNIIVPIDPLVPNFTVNKTADSYVYAPGQWVTFNIVITNESNTFGNVSVVDNLSSIKV